MKQLIAVMVLGAFLVAVGVGCGGSTPSPAKPATGTDKKDDKKDTK